MRRVNIVNVVNVIATLASGTSRRSAQERGLWGKSASQLPDSRRLDRGWFKTETVRAPARRDPALGFWRPLSQGIWQQIRSPVRNLWGSKRWLIFGIASESPRLGKTLDLKLRKSAVPTRARKGVSERRSWLDRWLRCCARAGHARW
jgi:hypothetical protein